MEIGSGTAGIFTAPAPANEPVRSYAPGSAERAALAERVSLMAKEPVDAPMLIGGEPATSAERFAVRAPHQRDLVLADVHAATSEDVRSAIDSCLRAAPTWASTPWHERAAVFLKAAELLAGSWRDTLNAATILGQSKSVFQAEIDAACEMIDFWRFNCSFADRIYAEQPDSAPGTWNRMDHRPLEGFVLALTPFNFTSIAGNLPTAPALMGNVVVWKPSEKQALSAHFTMQLLREAGLPDGVINLLHGDGALVSETAMSDPRFAGLHFTGSTTVFRQLWRRAGEQLETYRTYPRLVGETGGKDFVLAHPSADIDALAVALGRGAFEYQGQKCSAASRAYIPTSIWPALRDRLGDIVTSVTMGDVADLSTFMGALIDESAFRRNVSAIASARDAGAEVVVGGGSDDSVGWFVEPTVLLTDDPRSDTMVREIFGPVLSVFVYEDARFSDTCGLVDQTSPYALTGAIFAADRHAVVEATERLRGAAGNFYINDKPTGAVVGQQPFGGARASGTNDKAGSVLNLLRWVSPRLIKETFAPPVDWRYPHMG
ncbi:MAG TPA: L-glutamate gamma-semialdehyde dehydrogenase [Egibacteraceae bacterium]|nr:L-glutamate gamma-semialdehyde dehydrogenase [Egibacteraceae bacterium]